MVAPLPIPPELALRFADLQRYLGWSTEDLADVSTLREILLPSAEDFVADFYDELVKHPAAMRVLTGGDRQIERLKQSLRFWLQELLSGNYDDAYVQRRWKVGHRHVLIGLNQVYVSAALGRLRTQMTHALQGVLKTEPARCFALTATLNKLLDLDQILIHAAYDAEFHARQMPVNAARLQQQRWLTRISERALEGPLLDELFELALVAVSQSLHPACAVILALDATATAFHVVAESGWSKEARALDTNSKAWPGVGLQSAIPIVCEDLRADSRFQLPGVLIKANLVSGVVARIDGDDQPYGLMAVGFTSRILLTESDGDFIKSLANLLTTAVQRSQQNERRMASERRLKRLIDRLPAGAVYVMNQELLINAAVEAMTGYSRHELSQLKQWKEVARPQEIGAGMIEPTRPEPAEGAVTRYHELFRCRDGAERLIEIVAFRSTTDEVWLIHDVTDGELRRQQALQAERLAMIGQMITALAHEARNALQRMRASTETLELELEDRPDVLPVLNRLGAAQDDLKTLFDEVRNYAAPIVLACEEANLREIAQAAWESLADLWRSRTAHLVLRIPDELVLGRCDPFRIEQVLRNLFENSLAACSDPVNISLMAEPSWLKGHPAIELVIHDNGPGLPDMIKRRVFEPFFTTKAKGTGLGMAIAERIVVAHGGRIEIGTPACGAEFRIQIPWVHHETPASDCPG